MNTLRIVLQIVVACGLLNVWLVRPQLKTPYRGCHAENLKDEFIAYGLPLWFFYFTGILKVSSALLLLAGIWFPLLVFPSSLIISILMMGALVMHLKVNDPLKKSIPAFLMLIFSLIICLSSL